MSRLRQHLAEIHTEWQNLKAVWDHTRTGWRDEVALDFSLQDWQPLEDQVRAYCLILEETCDGVSRASDEAA